MALPAHILQQLPPALAGSISIQKDSEKFESTRANVLSLGLPELDEALPQGGLQRGAVVELQVQGAASLASSLGLMACRTAQREGLQHGEMPWCGFIDPSQSLYAPGVCQLGVQLKRLLIVRPSLESLQHVAVRMASSRCFSVLVIDTVGVAGSELNVSLGTWPKVVRRLALALEGTMSTVLLITSSDAHRPLALPVAQRIELCRTAEQKLMLQVAKDRQGRVATPRAIRWGDADHLAGAQALNSGGRLQRAGIANSIEPPQFGASESRSFGRRA
jgi:recombination protein RecA